MIHKKAVSHKIAPEHPKKPIVEESVEVNIPTIGTFFVIKPKRLEMKNEWCTSRILSSLQLLIRVRSVLPICVSKWLF